MRSRTSTRRVGSVVSSNSSGSNRNWGTIASLRAPLNATNAINTKREIANRAAIKRANAVQAANRFLMARQAYTDGDIQLASLLYRRTLSSRLASAEMKNEAAQVFTEYEKLASNELSIIQQTVSQLVVGEDTTEGSRGVEDPRLAALQSALTKLEDLKSTYQHVPRALGTLQRALDQLLTRDAAVANVLYEPVAAELVEQAREMERNDQICCAYLWYEEAVKLVPAPAAKTARKRMAAMMNDPNLQGQVDMCRKIRKCQERFDQAQRVAGQSGESNRKAARSMLRGIMESAPVDSEVRKAAERELSRLTRG